jgi:RNA-binding protein YlmH
MGAASLNYTICDRTDAPVKEGDILSLRGHGKGCLKAVGGRSKKDRLFVEAEVYL